MKKILILLFAGIILFQIQIFAQEADEEKKKEREKRGPNFGKLQPVKDEKKLKISRARIWYEYGKGYFISVAGIAANDPFPHRTMLHCCVNFKGRNVYNSWQRLYVKNEKKLKYGRFSRKMGPFKCKILSGKYKIRVYFIWMKQATEKRDKVYKDAPRLMLAEKEIYFGKEKREKMEDIKQREEINKMVNDLEKILKEVYTEYNTLAAWKGGKIKPAKFKTKGEKKIDMNELTEAEKEEILKKQKEKSAKFIYQVAINILLNNDNKRARKQFQRVIKHYPETSWAKRAELQIKKIDDPTSVTKEDFEKLEEELRNKEGKKENNGGKKKLKKSKFLIVSGGKAKLNKSAWTRFIFKKKRELKKFQKKYEFYRDEKYLAHSYHETVYDLQNAMEHTYDVHSHMLIRSYKMFGYSPPPPYNHSNLQTHPDKELALALKYFKTIRKKIKADSIERDKKKLKYE